ncbi:scopoletin glucosyltransferase-like [Senna tora]|uniref:Scopoletin glucosyltransferase-like n=1 Tax=Senna tora TaxID=362788 RepID=A0A834SY41_9FABA|nr:scopoletin glucosyltransferase-like [Senna tora]
MGSENHKLHIFFLPFPAHGHMIPMVDMARLFAARGVRATIVTTPLNLPLVSNTIGTTKTTTEVPDIVTIEFPCVEAGLPQGCENFDSIPSLSLIPKFLQATKLLQESFERLLLQHHPDSLVADLFFPWATDSADKFGIPRIVFHGSCSFSMSATECVSLHKPHKNVSSDSEPFVIPNLPGEIKITRMVLPDFVRNDEDNEMTRTQKQCKEAELRSYGVVMNSFYGLEHVYADYYREILGKKAWFIGPVSLCNRDVKEKSYRGKQASIDEHECLKWLDSKKPNSVVYICFGSRSDFTQPQLRELAMGLEASGQDFIWVVNKSKKEDDQWLPEGFEKRMEGKGLIIRGWAPQVLILDHEAVGGFVTHCGWNSTLEGISAGVAMVTWPLSAEQFYNEKFVTEVLGIGVAVGVKKWVRMVGDSVGKEAIEKGVRRIMEGEEAEEMRNKVKEFAKMARQAVEEGGSSYLELSALIQELGSSYMAKLFAARGVRATIVTTPLNLPFVSKTIGIPKPNILIDLVPIKFPCLEAGLPEGCENADAIPPSSLPNFFKAIHMLQHPFEQLLLQYRPDCIISDMFLSWTTHLAAKFQIPRIVFHGTGSFALCAMECVRLYEPYKIVSSDSEPFVIPNLPGEIEMTRVILPEYARRNNSGWVKMIGEVVEAELKSFGVVTNSFYEMEEVYADHYKKVLGRKAWHIGPVSLCNRDIKEKSNRGKEASIDEEECLKWLDSKQPNSVLYVSFGSLTIFPESQLKEIALGLEASGQNFIWVVRKNQKDDWIPEGFEERMEGKGLIIRGWAPQMLILEHEAVGGFVTHCGWNSTLEGINAGLPMVTWPVFAEQFYNEKFITEVLKIGVAVGVKRWGEMEAADSVRKEAIEKAVRKIMEEEEGEEMRKRVKSFAKMGKEAVEEGGSSYLSLSALIEELQSCCRH